MSEPRVAVIGSGVAGASTAFALARGGADVTIIESGYVGQATAAGAGIIQPWSSTSDGSVYELYAAGASYYPRFVELLADSGVTDIGYRVSGSIVVDADPDRLDEVERRVRARTVGIPAAGTIERVDESAARSLFPPLARGLQALHISGGARVDGRRLRDGLLEAAGRHGAVLVSAEAHLDRRSDGPPVVQAGGERFEVDAVVVAGGAWTNRLLAPIGYSVPVEPQRGQITHVLLDGVDTSGWPSVLPMASHYLVSFDHGRLAVGATRETGSGFDPRVTAGGLRDVLSSALEIAPGLAEATVLETRVGLRPLADGQAPFIGAVPGRPGLYVNAGFGAAGLTMAPVVGDALAQQILRGASEVDLSPFALPEAPLPPRG
jgi:D-amino-acid dehydrogenase